MLRIENGAGNRGLGADTLVSVVGFLEINIGVDIQNIKSIFKLLQFFILKQQSGLDIVFKAGGSEISTHQYASFSVGYNELRMKIIQRPAVGSFSMQRLQIGEMCIDAFSFLLT